MAEQFEIDGYEVLEHLTEAWGSFNRGMYRVEHQQSKESFLCKTLDGGDGYPEILKLKQLKHHPNITHMHDYSAASTNSWQSQGVAPWNNPTPDHIYLEYCDDRTLRDLINDLVWDNEYRSEEFIWHVFEELAHAVLYCHTGKRRPGQVVNGWKEIIHRDIIPSNIFFSKQNATHDRFPRVVLGDFGCAAHISELVSARAGRAPLQAQDTQFAPPEVQASPYDKGIPYYHIFCGDIYQVGLAIWCLCHRDNHPPFSEDLSFLELHDAQKGRWVQKWYSRYSDELREVISACLNEDHWKRPDAESLVTMIQRARGGKRN